MSDYSEKLRLAAEDAGRIAAQFLPENKGLAGELLESMAYSVNNGGKRLRPVLLRESFHENGGEPELEKMLVEPYMAALEYIHSYSLVHDDLPEMDNDMYRRGKLTTHAKFGHAQGVLAGDGLLNYAYETAGKAFENALFSGNETALRRTVKAFNVLTNKAGAYGMVGGQSVDVALTGKSIDPPTLEYIYENKTSALIEAALMIGGILAGADDDRIAILEKIGSACGRAFQIKDDILDETGTLEEIGKPVHSDVNNNKTTYVTLFGLEKAEKDAGALCVKAEEMLKTFSTSDSFLSWLIAYMTKRVK
ncbi:MAG: polyprenyl synthetase family protein [Lachnospiraceae bacterium]|nr:polyprenyl synthetase family protein [Lachnospiraceae bacterium]